MQNVKKVNYRNCLQQHHVGGVAWPAWPSTVVTHLIMFVFIFPTFPFWLQSQNFVFQVSSIFFLCPPPLCCKWDHCVWVWLCRDSAAALISMFSELSPTLWLTQPAFLLQTTWNMSSSISPTLILSLCSPAHFWKCRSDSCRIMQAVRRRGRPHPRVHCYVSAPSLSLRQTL